MDSNQFWEFSVQFYKHSRVREILLAWQEHFDIDINMVLYCYWCASSGVGINSEHLQLLCDRVAEWRRECIAPLRSVRRYLRDTGDTAMYQSLLELELMAENRQQNVMFEWFGSLQAGKHLPAAPANTASQNLRNYCALLSTCEWSDLRCDGGELEQLLLKQHQA